MQDFQYKLLKELEANPHLTQREMAQSLGVSLGKTNYCLKALIEKGWIKATNFKNNKNKMGYIYLLTPTGIESKARLTSDFLKRKMVEYDALKAEIEQLRREIGEGR